MCRSGWKTTRTGSQSIYGIFHSMVGIPAFASETGVFRVRKILFSGTGETAWGEYSLMAWQEECTDQ